MGLLINGIVSWIFKHLRNLIIIILVLVIGGKTKDFIQTEIEEYRILSSDSTKLISEKNQLDQYIDKIANDVTLRIVQYESDTVDRVNLRIAGINAEIQSKKDQRKKDENLATLLGQRPVFNGFAELVKLDVEINLLIQEKDWLSKIHKRKEAPLSLEKARQDHISAYGAFTENQKKLNKYKADHPLKTALTDYGLRADGELTKLEKRDKTLRAENRSAKEAYDKKLRQLKLVSSGKIQFKMLKDSIDSSFAPIKEDIEKAIADRKKNLLENWVTQAKQPIEKVLPTALMILLTVIFGRIGFKAVFFYFLTPIASRRPPVVLLPQSSGLME